MGRVMYERLPNQQLHGFDDDVVRIKLKKDIYVRISAYNKLHTCLNYFFLDTRNSTSISCSRKMSGSMFKG